MNAYTAIEQIAFPADDADAQAMLDALKAQDGYIGGRILPAGPGKALRVQGFFQSDVQVTDWTKAGELNAALPEGLAYRLILKSQEAALGLK
jgi:hypothetical protein